jgi:hypothetical protein
LSVIARRRAGNPVFPYFLSVNYMFFLAMFFRSCKILYASLNNYEMLTGCGKTDVSRPDPNFFLIYFQRGSEWLNQSL